MGAGAAACRAMYAVDLTVDGQPFGQVEEGFVTVVDGDADARRSAV